MYIGFMRNFAKPPYMAKLTAMICKYHGLELIYIRPKDVDMENNRVRGKVYIRSKWIPVETDLPHFIDISPYCFKHKELMSYLRKNTILSDSGLNRLGKEKLQQYLSDDEKFSHIVIPTLRVKDIDDVEEFIGKYSKIVLKPLKGERGKDIYSVEKNQENFVVSHYTKEKTFSREEFIEFFEENIKSRRYIAQKFVNSRTIKGDPFDCRIHVEKNIEGKWVIAKKFIRIGIGQKIISNVNQGGGISDPEPFLKANFGDKWKEIDQKLNELGTSLPYKIEELRNTKLMTLGMDIGIDKDGSLFIFETNSAPTTKPLRSEAAMYRVEYYLYCLNKYTNLFDDHPKLFAKQYIVSGKVQNVGYRNWIKQEATKDNLNGFVQNLPNGNVEVVVGSKKIDKVLAFEEKCKKGPKNAKVERVKSFDWNKKLARGFKIKNRNQSSRALELKRRNSRLNSELKRLEQEKEFYKKNYEGYENLVRWLIIKPISKITSVIKTKQSHRDNR